MLFLGKTGRVQLTVARLNGKAGASSNSAASKSWRCTPLKNFGKAYCLTGTKSMIIKGNITPAIGTQVSPKQISRYVVWNSVKVTIALKGTVSTKVAWYSSRTLKEIYLVWDGELKKISKFKKMGPAKIRMIRMGKITCIFCLVQ